MALSAVYFRITHRLVRSHYVWDEYLYSVLEKIEVRVTVCVTVCVVWDDDERKGEGETRCRLIACSSRKAPKGPPGLMSPTDESLSTVLYAFSTYILRKGLEFNPGLLVYNLGIRKCTSPPLLAPRLKIFKLKLTTPPGIEPRTC